MFKKAMRTLQNFFPSLGEAKNEFYHLSRTKFGRIHDPEFAAIAHLPREERELLIDVGANRGQSIIAFRRFRPEAAIVSFEPSPNMFRWLEERFAKWPGVRLVNYGLGPRTDSRMLYVPSYRGFMYDGLATFEAEKSRAFLSSDTVYFFDPAKVDVHSHLCESRTLDSFDLAPTFMKIDVEGGEYDVLAGATETLRTHEPTLMIERFYDDDRISGLLAGLGYQEVRLEGTRFVAGKSAGLNMFWMTARRLDAATRSD
jgi:FkbM family methyltransferase